MTGYARRHLEERQIHRRWMDPRLYDLRIPAVRGYLFRKGWKEATSDQPGFLVFAEPNPTENPLHQWIPDQESRREFYPIVYEFLAAVAEIEDRSAVEVLSDMLASQEDHSTNGAPKPRHTDVPH